MVHVGRATRTSRSSIDLGQVPHVGVDSSFVSSLLLRKQISCSWGECKELGKVQLSDLNRRSHHAAAETGGSPAARAGVLGEQSVGMKAVQERVIRVAGLRGAFRNSGPFPPGRSPTKMVSLLTRRCRPVTKRHLSRSEGNVPVMGIAKPSSVRLVIAVGAVQGPGRGCHRRFSRPAKVGSELGKLCAYLRPSADSPGRSSDNLRVGRVPTPGTVQFKDEVR